MGEEVIATPGLIIGVAGVNTSGDLVGGFDWIEVHMGDKDVG